MRADPDRGVVTLYWKENERDDLAEDFAYACEQIARNPNARKLNYSCSATMAIYSEEQILSRLTTWCLWHQHWIYQTPCTAVLPIAMPLRDVLPGGPHGNPPLAVNEEVREVLFDDDDEVVEESEDLGSATDSLGTQSSDSGSMTSSIFDEQSGSSTMDMD